MRRLVSVCLHWICMLACASTLVATVWVIAPRVAAPVLAAESMPATDWSFYILDTNTNTMYTLGCNQGKFDAARGINSLVVIDFGVQTSDGTETQLINGTYVANATIEDMADAFANGYYTCTGTDSTTVLHLALGTNDSVYSYSASTYTTLGKDWASLVSTTETQIKNAGYQSQVEIWGANDLESWLDRYGHFTPSTDAYGWVNGYSSVNPAPYINFGSADGCPTSAYNNAACGSGYKQADYWYFSWGAAPALVAPEIYYAPPNGDNAEQWTQISLYATHYQKGMAFQAPWDENDLDSSTLTSAQAWSYLYNDLVAAGVSSSMPYSEEIHDE